MSIELRQKIEAQKKLYIGFNNVGINVDTAHFSNWYANVQRTDTVV